MSIERHDMSRQSLQEVEAIWQEMKKTSNQSALRAAELQVLLDDPSLDVFDRGLAELESVQEAFRSFVELAGNAKKLLRLGVMSVGDMAEVMASVEMLQVDAEQHGIDTIAILKHYQL